MSITIRPASEWASLEPGFYRDVPDEVYHATDACSNSALTTIFNDNEAKLEHERKHPSDPTPAQIFGRNAHACVLEPERFRVRFDKARQCEGVTKGGTRCSYNGSVRMDGRWYCGTHAKKAGGEPDDINVVSESDYDALTAMQQALEDHDAIGKILNLPGHREISGLWIDPATELLCKMRIDFLLDEHGAAWDYKTIGSSVKDDDVSWQIWNRGYHRQAPLYLSGCHHLGLPISDFGFIFQEKTGPYFCRPFRLNDSALSVGVSQLRELMKRYKRAKETGIWQGYDDGGIVPIDLPEKVINYDLTDGERSAIYQGEVTLT